MQIVFALVRTEGAGRNGCDDRQCLQTQVSHLTAGL